MISHVVSHINLIWNPRVIVDIIAGILTDLMIKTCKGIVNVTVDIFIVHKDFIRARLVKLLFFTLNV